MPTHCARTWATSASSRSGTRIVASSRSNTRYAIPTGQRPNRAERRRKSLTFRTRWRDSGLRATPEQLRVFDTMLTPFEDDDSLRAAWTTILPLYLRREAPEIGAALLQNTTFSAAAFNHVASNFMPTFNVQTRLSEIQVPC